MPSDLATRYFALLEAHQDTLSRHILETFLAHQARSETEHHLDRHLVGRSRFFLNSILPWIGDYIDVAASDFIEIGPGTGATTAPLALASRRVRAYDISERSSGVARFRCDTLGVKNAEIACLAPEALLARIRADHADSKADAVLMFAVLEHMLPEERLGTLAACWDALSDRGILIVGDTPSRIALKHGHTARMPFFDALPLAILRRCTQHIPNRDFAAALEKWSADGLSDAVIEERIGRWGRGVSFHEFAIALGEDLAALTLAEGLEPRILRAMPVTQAERLMMQYLNSELPQVPLGFARSSLYLIFSKDAALVRSRNWRARELMRSLL